MAHHQRRDRQIPKLQAILKMVFSSDQPSVPADQEVEVVDDCDEPPDRNHLHNRPNHDQIYVKSSLVVPEKKESLLTRALLKNPEEAPMDRYRKPSYPTSNTSGHSTAELTSDGDLTSPTYSNTSSPPHLATFQLAPVLETSDPSESKIEAGLGRKRCISFACTSRQPERPKSPEKKSQIADQVQPAPRKSRLTFVCPSRQSEARPANSRRSSYNCRGDRSPPPTSRRASPADDKAFDSKSKAAEGSAVPAKKPGTIHMPGLGDFKPSEETRFHEFASSLDEEDGWVSQSTEHQEKITVADCMKKELAIRKLGEEAEAEAIAEEEEAEDLENDDDEDDTVDLDDDEDEEEEDVETIHDFSSDDGNESDNEAGFADSDDESDGDSDYEFWAPATTTAATSADNLDIVRLAIDRRNSNTSIESLKQERSRPPSSTAGSKGKSRRGINIPRATTPDLPDSTDFVCGTLDEDRPLEAAYMSCIEERRRKKHVPVPQDIDPSFPTTDPEDVDDDDDNDDVAENDDDPAQDDDEDVADAARIEDDLLRGRSKGAIKKKARASPRRVHSPAPRAHGQVSPKRMKSPAPKSRHAVAAAGLPAITIPAPRTFTRISIACPTQRPHHPRTKSLPRTPNPFFKGMEESRQSLNPESPTVTRSREMHTRGPIDIIQGLERKRQKRKEKFWRQHCRKAAAKEQSDRRPARGKGAERMKELGLEMAERAKAYGVGQDTQLMLSV